MLRRLFKRPLHALGLDLVKYHPRYVFRPYAHATSLGIKTVIDIGAHEGDFARMMRQMLPNALIVSFEPARESFERLSNTLRDKSNFLLFNCALGDDDATQRMHCYSDSMTSSLLPMADLHKQAFPVAGDERSEMVEVKRLDDVLAIHPLEAEILVKIDVQGYEDKVIRGGEQVISRARAVVVEVSFQSLYEGQPLFDSIHNLMAQRGFTYAGSLYQLFSPVDNSILQADALFIRR